MSCTCRTPKHRKNKEKNIETHFAYEDNDFDYYHMDVAYLYIVFFAKLFKANHVIDDESVNTHTHTHTHTHIYIYIYII